MQTHRLGATALQVPVVSFGTGSIGGFFGSVDENAAIALVSEAIDHGITLFDTSPYYGLAEERLGKALSPARRDAVILATKAGRYGRNDFDFRPERIRQSVQESLRRLNTDRVDILQLHDIEFAPLGPIFDDTVAELLRLRQEGCCRFIGMTGYPVATFTRVLTETPVDVVLTYAKSTLLDDALTTDLVPLARQSGVGVMNAAAVASGLLTPRGPADGASHAAPSVVQDAARRMRELAAARGADIAFLANQYSIQRSDADTTVVGVGRPQHLHAAIAAAQAPIDEELLDELLTLRPDPASRSWRVGLEENNQ